MTSVLIVVLFMGAVLSLIALISADSFYEWVAALQMLLLWIYFLIK